MGIGAIFHDDQFLNKISFYDSYDLFFHIGMEAWDGG